MTSHHCLPSYHYLLAIRCDANPDRSCYMLCPQWPWRQTSQYVSTASTTYGFAVGRSLLWVFDELWRHEVSSYEMSGSPYCQWLAMASNLLVVCQWFASTLSGGWLPQGRCLRSLPFLYGAGDQQEGQPPPGIISNWLSLNFASLYDHPALWVCFKYIHYTSLYI